MWKRKVVDPSLFLMWKWRKKQMVNFLPVYQNPTNTNCFFWNLNLDILFAKNEALSNPFVHGFLSISIKDFESKGGRRWRKCMWSWGQMGIFAVISIIMIFTRKGVFENKSKTNIEITRGQLCLTWPAFLKRLHGACGKQILKWATSQWWRLLGYCTDLLRRPKECIGELDKCRIVYNITHRMVYDVDCH